MENSVGKRCTTPRLGSEGQNRIQSAVDLVCPKNHVLSLMIALEVCDKPLAVVLHRNAVSLPVWFAQLFVCPLEGAIFLPRPQGKRHRLVGSSYGIRPAEDDIKLHRHHATELHRGWGKPTIQSGRRAGPQGIRVLFAHVVVYSLAASRKISNNCYATSQKPKHRFGVSPD